MKETEHSFRHLLAQALQGKNQNGTKNELEKATLMPSVVTANVLRSGAVVYLADDGQWVEQLAEATVAADAEGLKRLEAVALVAVEKTEVTAVYAMDVAVAQGRPEPVSVREAIRAARAPSI